MQSRALETLLEDPGLVPSTHMEMHPLLAIMASWTLQECDADRQICRQKSPKQMNKEPSVGAHTFNHSTEEIA